ncbi:hypothetical protein [Massilia sp.]|uniref:hypothetical protein n=1 Tax=Massilia sp. TaxID=1882437 RepID=UPI002896E7D2|nr:hypothetical protein [Massilia sp.]
MSRLIDFLKANRSGTARLLPLKQSENALTVAVSRELGEIQSGSKPLLSAREAGTTANQISALAYDERFLGELSDVIGTPKPGETEDEFVARCKAQMASLLRLKFAN